MKCLLLLLFLLSTYFLQAQKHVYSVELFGKKIGQTVVERSDKGMGEVNYKLTSRSEANVLFVRKTSNMDYDVTYKNGQLFSSYCKNVKDNVTEIATIAWNGTQYLIHKGEDVLKLAQPLDFSAVQLYFSEPKNRTSIFSERMGEFCKFVRTADGVYECKLANGVTNIYRYKNGTLYELEMNKGASVFMRLVP